MWRSLFPWVTKLYQELQQDSSICSQAGDQAFSALDRSDTTLSIHIRHLSITDCIIFLAYLWKKESTAHLGNAQIMKLRSGHDVLVLLLSLSELFQDKAISTELMHC